MIRALILVALAAALAAPAAAAADPYLPPAGKAFTGVTAGFDAADIEQRTGKHPAVWQHFIAWGGHYRYTIANSQRAGSRLMLHVSTAKGQKGPETLSPGEIARGEGDGFLVGLTRDLAEVGAPVYVRLMAEMNNCDNAYASHACSGARRDADHSARAYKRAWKRTHVILHGGAVSAIDARLSSLGLAPLRSRAESLPAPGVAFVWAPMVGGSPNVAALAPGRFWPGSAWVDWVGTSFYSRFPNWSGLEVFHDRFAAGKDKPFAFAEWAMWGSDSAGFAERLFDWTASHRRVRMLQYNQGAEPGGIFRLSHYPAAARVIRERLAHPRFAGFAREHE